MNQPTQIVTTILMRLQRKLRILTQGRASCYNQVLAMVEGKRGLEIGGPTNVFQGWRRPSRTYWSFAPLPIYDHIGALDNCNFANATIWGQHEAAYSFSPQRPLGKIIIAEGSNIGEIQNSTYDFVLSSHNLEHFANPVKALLEWKRITRPEGSLILVLPHYKHTFDHRRKPTSVEHMLEDYRNSTSEEDMTHVEEVLALHDPSLDGFLKTDDFEEFKTRCDNNKINRSMHHHVFDETSITELLQRVGLDVLSVEFSRPYHIIVNSRWKSNSADNDS